MAQRLDESEPVPERLARFVLSEGWPADVSEATAAWGAECRAWLEANPGRQLPHSDGPVEVRQEVIRLRAELLAGRDSDDHGPWRD